MMSGLFSTNKEECDYGKQPILNEPEVFSFDCRNYSQNEKYSSNIYQVFLEYFGTKDPSVKIRFKIN
jgi:hypothetical protein